MHFNGIEALLTTGMRGSESTTTKGRKYPKDQKQNSELLGRQERKIAELKASLEKVRKENASLRQEVEPYCIQKQPRNSKAENRTNINYSCPIQECPDDVLYLIFEQVILHLEEHYHIMLLIQVCQRWKAVIITSPKLWTRIEITNPWMLFDFITRKSMASYISSCVKYSIDMPLHVSLRLYILDQESYMKAQLGECIDSITAVSHTRRPWETQNKIDALCTGFRSPKYHQDLERAIIILAGINGEHASRWESLTIQLPINKDDSVVVWTRVVKMITNVRTLKVYRFCKRSLKADEFEDEPRFSREIKNLHFETSEFDPVSTLSQIFNLSPTYLESLTIDIHEGDAILRELSSFSNLRILNIRHGGYGIEGSFKISLPNLIHLSLNGGYYSLRRVGMEFPALEFLDIGFTYRWEIRGLSPRRLRIRGGKSRFEDQENEAIRSILLSFDTIQIVITEEGHKDSFIGAIAECKAAGKALGISRLIVEYPDDVTEEIGV